MWASSCGGIQVDLRSTTTRPTKVINWDWSALALCGISWLPLVTATFSLWKVRITSTAELRKSSWRCVKLRRPLYSNQSRAYSNPIRATTFPVKPQMRTSTAVRTLRRCGCDRNPVSSLVALHQLRTEAKRGPSLRSFARPVADRDGGQARPHHRRHDLPPSLRPSTNVNKVPHRYGPGGEDTGHPSPVLAIDRNALSGDGVHHRPGWNETVHFVLSEASRYGVLAEATSESDGLQAKVSRAGAWRAEGLGARVDWWAGCQELEVQ